MRTLLPVAVFLTSIISQAVSTTCGGNSTSATTNPTTSAVPDPVPTTSPSFLAVGMQECYQAFTGHKAVDEEEVRVNSHFNCQNLPRMDGSSPEVPFVSTPPSGPALRFSISWVENCTVQAGFQDPSDPVNYPSLNCTMLLLQDYQNCK